VESSWWDVYAVLSRGWLLVITGEWEEARPTLEEALATAERDGDLQAQRYGSAPLALLDLADGRPDLAVVRLERLLDRPDGEDTDVLYFLPVLAEAHLARGDKGRSEEVLDEAIRRAKKDGLNLHLVDALRVQGILRTAHGRWEEAQSALDEALALARAMPYPHMEARILHACGALLFQKGERRLARLRMEEALAIFHRLGAKKDMERTEQALHDLG